MNAHQLLTCREKDDKNCTVNLKWNHLETVSSTNAFLSDMAREQAGRGEAAVIADYQSSGRGQGTHSWFSDRGENLLMSVLLYPEFLSASAQFNLSVITSLAVCDLIRDSVAEPVIKWPNDILTGGRKIAGILIENGIMGGNLSHTVIGVGLNVNQERFPEFLWRATSMAMESGRRYDLVPLAEGLAVHLLKYYELLKRGNVERLRKTYLEHLYLMDEPAGYISDGKLFEGIVRGITEYGELMVESEGRVSPYGMDEIRLDPNQ